MNQVDTVVFPAVGTGNLGYSMQGVADAMIDAIYEHLSTNLGTSIQQVSLVIYYDEACYEVRGETLTKHNCATDFVLCIFPVNYVILLLAWETHPYHHLQSPGVSLSTTNTPCSSYSQRLGGGAGDPPTKFFNACGLK